MNVIAIETNEQIHEEDQPTVNRTLDSVSFLLDELNNPSSDDMKCRNLLDEIDASIREAYPEIQELDDVVGVGDGYFQRT